MRSFDEIIIEIRQLEQELMQELHKKQEQYSYIVEGKRVRFSREVRDYHRIDWRLAREIVEGLAACENRRAERPKPRARARRRPPPSAACPAAGRSRPRVSLG